MQKNESKEDYFVGGRNIGSWHIGLSVVATDVGGGFSIGLGGLGFIMGLSGSWMLFTGLVGAWLAAVLLIPIIKSKPAFSKLYTFPQVFKHLYNSKVAFLAAIISFIGYLGFTSSQILAGAKLASGTFPVLDLNSALLIMGVISVIYTVLGGIKAVIYTDTIQWIILIAGFIFIGLPYSYWFVGGYEGIKGTLPSEFFSLANISWQQIVNWSITIIPIWFVGMTLYQRIFASKDEQSAKKAWFIAGLFEYPIMAFMGVGLGLISRVAFEQGLLSDSNGLNPLIDPEMGLPLLLSKVLPVGLLGLMMSSYFSAILSTADSCLMAASGNLTTDLLSSRLKNVSDKSLLRISQLITLFVGAIAVFISLRMTNVLSLMLYSYAFMVSGLLVPLVAGLFFNRKNPVAALCSMIMGGGSTLLLSIFDIHPYPGLDPNIYGITISALSFLLIEKLNPFYLIKNQTT